MQRRPRTLIIAVAVFAFLILSAALTRALSVDGAERSAITGLIEAEARGDAEAMLRLMTGCAPGTSCGAMLESDAGTLKRTGAPLILRLDPSANFSLTGTHGYARVAWKTAASLPIVQCVEVRHTGSVLSGLTVELLRIGPRIKTDGVCPGQS